MPDYNSAELGAARYAPLTAQPSSDDAVRLCASLSQSLLHQRKGSPTAKQQRAFNALVADLIERNPADQGGWLYRSLSANEFTGEGIGYRPFMAVFRPMAGFMIDLVGGTRQYADGEFTGGKRQKAWDRAARFRATDWLRKWFAEQGITRENWGDHFLRERPSTLRRQSPVLLRAMKRAGPASTPYGRKMDFNHSDPKVAAIIERMNRLNAFLGEQSVVPYGPVFLRRIYSNGDQPGFAWETGGRLYALGDNFQTAKKNDRAAILINGEPTIELDIRASHVTIMVGLGHLPAAVLDGDPYSVEGLPREVVKQWATMTISHGKRHKRWPLGAKKEFAETYGWDLTRDFPITATGDAILTKLPILGDDGETSAVSWGQLQFLESEVLLKTIEAMAFDHGFAALPVHDSVIVPEGKSELASALLRETFRATVGVEPLVN